MLFVLLLRWYHFCCALDCKHLPRELHVAQTLVHFVTFTFANVSLSDSNQRSASGGRLDGGGLNGTIGHLAPITTAIPEPSSWALVFVSLAALGATLLRQGKRVSGQSTIQ